MLQPARRLLLVVLGRRVRWRDGLVVDTCPKEGEWHLGEDEVHHLCETLQLCASSMSPAYPPCERKRGGK
jgi:hypothetical protein